MKMPSGFGTSSWLPLPKGWSNEDDYVEALLHFVTSSHTLKQLYGGVHILDFFVSSPDLYARTLDPEWRSWFQLHSIEALLDFLFREDVSAFLKAHPDDTWRGQPLPPKSFVEFVATIQSLQLKRDFMEHAPVKKFSTQVATGMEQKKIHEVQHYADYVDRIAKAVTGTHQDPISHLIDFGAGQGYLGRALASKPYHHRVIAVEGRPHNVQGARSMDTTARIAPKAGIRRNKKEFRTRLDIFKKAKELGRPQMELDRLLHEAFHSNNEYDAGDVVKEYLGSNNGPSMKSVNPKPKRNPQDSASSGDGKGSVCHIEHRLEDGNLQEIVNRISSQGPSVFPMEGTACKQSNGSKTPERASFLVMSLHSCGNLSHHALRSITMNPDVAAVAIIGCCYNLATERLTPPSYKLPSLRPAKDDPSYRSCGDPHGFPMSQRVCNYGGDGVHLNITGRMMGVQAPSNWGREDSSKFFTRHYYRALLQRVFLDYGVADPPVKSDTIENSKQDAEAGRSAAGGSITQPIIIGCLRRSCYVSFVDYSRGAIEKLWRQKQLGGTRISRIQEITDEELRNYDEIHGERKKELSVMWTLMAFSATLVESTIVVDRWLWLREQQEVRQCWVEPVFDYKQSPRNLVVVGLK